MVLLEPQTAEQLVEVPTVVSFSSLQQTAEHVIDIPVPRTFGDRGGSEGFSPGQGSSQRTVEQIVLVVVFKIFSLILGCQPHPQSRVLGRFKGFFALFPELKKVHSPPAGRV